MLQINVLGLSRWACLALLLSTLCSCRYNFIPIVPAQAVVALPVRITAANLQRSAGGLAVNAQVLTPRSGYLSVVWYSQDTELGRDSVYIEAATGTPRRPAQVHFAWPLSGGAPSTSYRAMLLFEGDLLREVDEGAGLPAGTQSVQATPLSVNP